MVILSGLCSFVDSSLFSFVILSFRGIIEVSGRSLLCDCFCSPTALYFFTEIVMGIKDESGGVRFKPVCRECGDSFALRRFKAGYRLCLFCGEEAAMVARKSWCVAPMHKSNYTLITNRADLAGLNNKGGLVK